MEKIKAAVIGYGNIGKYVIEALQTAPDFEIAGIVRRNASQIPAEIAQYKVVGSLKELFSDTIRLNTSLSGVVSLASTQKNPFLTNWKLS